MSTWTIAKTWTFDAAHRLPHREVGADSIDSSSPLWSAEKLAAWVAAVQAPDAQGRLFA